MEWTDEGPVTGASRAELLDGIERRGLGLRRRRRRARVLLGGAVVALAVSAVALRLGGGQEGTELTAAAPSTPATAPVTAPVETTAPAATTTAAPPTTPATTPGPPATTRPVPTTAAPDTAPPLPATIAPPAPGPPCGAAHLVAVVAAERPVYQPGERVVAISTVRNQSTSPCYYDSYNFSMAIRDPSGAVVQPTSVLHADNFALSPFAPGETMTQRQEWDQRLCPPPAGNCAQAPPGRYSATATWQFSGPAVEASTTFVLASGTTTSTTTAG